MGKREIGHYKLLFPLCFQKTRTADRWKTGLVLEGVNSLLTGLNYLYVFIYVFNLWHNSKMLILYQVPYMVRAYILLEMPHIQLSPILLDRSRETSATCLWWKCWQEKLYRVPAIWGFFLQLIPQDQQCYMIVLWMMSISLWSMSFSMTHRPILNIWLHSPHSREGQRSSFHVIISIHYNRRS